MASFAFTSHPSRLLCALLRALHYNPVWPLSLRFSQCIAGNPSIVPGSVSGFLDHWHTPLWTSARIPSGFISPEVLITINHWATETLLDSLSHWNWTYLDIDFQLSRNKSGFPPLTEVDALCRIINLVYSCLINQCLDVS